MRWPSEMRRRFWALVLLPGLLSAGQIQSSGGSKKKRRKELATIGSHQTLVPIATGLSSPVYITNAHDGTNRLFIVEQPGRIKVLQPGVATPTVFLDVASKVILGSEQGLLGLAFHPQFDSNRRFFVNYTRAGDGATVIAEYQASASNPNVADTNETVILTIAQPFVNHNGGMIEFGPDGFLYVGMGDGGGGNDPGNRAQNINQLLGKILRIDIDRPNGSIPYSSPIDNPFFGSTPGLDEIYAVGMRNPFRFSFDRMTGELYVGDVGQGLREEVDLTSLGGNYGWRVFEGTLCTNLDPPLCVPGNFTFPIGEYSHTPEGRCAILGGYVYRGVMSSLPFGAYVYGDLCTGEVFLLQAGQQRLLLDTSALISSFGEDEIGEIYLCNLGGSVSRIGLQPGSSDDTGSLYDPSRSRFFLRSSNSTGNADGVFNYGPAGAGWIAIGGDWNGDGVATIGLYNPTTSTFFLRNTNTSEPADVVFTFGPAAAGWIPVVGDWNGDGVDTIGLYNPTTSTFFLRNSNTSGPADLAFSYGPAGAGWLPLTGDWNGDGTDTIGLYNPVTSVFFLRNSNTSAPADLVFSYGPAGAGWIPMAGDWNGDGTDTIGLYKPATSTFFLRNSNTSAPADLTFGYGPAGAGWRPIAANWDGL